MERPAAAEPFALGGHMLGCLAGQFASQGDLSVDHSSCNQQRISSYQELLIGRHRKQPYMAP